MFVHSPLHKGLFLKHFLPYFANHLFLNMQVFSWYKKILPRTEVRVATDKIRIPPVFFNTLETSRCFPNLSHQHSPASYQQSLYQQSAKEVTKQIVRNKRNHTHRLTTLEHSKWRWGGWKTYTTHMQGTRDEIRQYPKNRGPNKPR